MSFESMRFLYDYACVRDHVCVCVYIDACADANAQARASAQAHARIPACMYVDGNARVCHHLRRRPAVLVRDRVTARIVPARPSRGSLRLRPLPAPVRPAVNGGSFCPRAVRNMLRRRPLETPALQNGPAPLSSGLGLTLAGRVHAEIWEPRRPTAPRARQKGGLQGGRRCAGSGCMCVGRQHTRVRGVRVPEPAYNERWRAPANKL